MYTIELSDGTKIENLKLNGNNFIANQEIEDSVFENNLDEVTVSDGENTVTYHDMKLIANRLVEGKSWFILAEKTKEEKEKEKLDKELTDLWDIVLFGGV